MLPVAGPLSLRRGGRLFVGIAILAILLLETSAMGQWSQWGGPDRDFKTSSSDLALKWPSSGPKVLWTNADGRPGLASMLVHENLLFVMCRYDDWEEALHMLNTRTGEREGTLMFRAPVPEMQRRSVSTSPRSTPVIAGDYVYVMSFIGHLVCFNWRAKQYEWTQKLALDFNGTYLDHGYTSSPIRYGENIIIQLGGERTGFMAIAGPEERAPWLSAPFPNSYAAPVIIQVGEVDHLVGMTADQVVAVNADDGRDRWKFSHACRGTSHLIGPVWGPDNLLFLPASKAGETCRMLKVTPDGKKTNVEQVWASSDVALGPGTVIRAGEYLYGSGGEEGAYHLTAVKAATGDVVWRDDTFSLAAMVYADGKLIIRDSDGNVAIATPGPEKLTIHAKARLLGKSPASAPIVVDNVLYVRDDEEVRAFDLSAKANAIP